MWRKAKTIHWKPFQEEWKTFSPVLTLCTFSKCIRNNRLAHGDTCGKTFTFLAVHSQGITCTGTMNASFSHLQRLFQEEKSSVVKLVPSSLTQKCLNPTATEKQNVKLMLKIFDQRNVAALEHFEQVWQVDSSGTRQFLQSLTVSHTRTSGCGLGTVGPTRRLDKNVIFLNQSDHTVAWWVEEVRART